MSKIQTLSNEEAQQLRIQLLQAYKSDTGKDFTPVTYLGAYAPLRTFFLYKLEERSESEDSLVGTSISLHRLRKLFYYSDPTICPIDKLETPSFGDDFISQLRKLTQANSTATEIPTSDKETSKKKKKTLTFIIVGVLSLVLISCFLIDFMLFKPYYFRDDFQNNSVDALRQRGWEIMDYDSTLFLSQVDSELTLMTSRGDYWMRGSDTPMIKNVVYHKVPEMDCFELTIKFRVINNFEQAQQGAIFLFDKNLNRSNNIRIDFVGEKEYESNNTIYQRSLGVIKNHNGDVTQDLVPISQSEKSVTIFILIVKQYNKIQYYYKFNYEYLSYEKLKTDFYIDYEPRYIALAAFNGYRLGEGLNAPLIDVESVPAKFDWVKIQECE